MSLVSYLTQRRNLTLVLFEGGVGKVWDSEDRKGKDKKNEETEIVWWVVANHWTIKLAYEDPVSMPSDKDTRFKGCKLPDVWTASKLPRCGQFWHNTGLTWILRGSVFTISSQHYGCSVFFGLLGLMNQPSRWFHLHRRQLVPFWMLHLAVWFSCFTHRCWKKRWCLSRGNIHTRSQKA